MLPAVIDAAALAPGMDGVVLVAKPGVTRLAAFKQSLEQLQGVGAKILGVVLNEVEPNSRKYGYYYHRYYSKYSYYYSVDGTKKKKSHKEPAKEEELKQD
jgi:Mrp family chromosome partitioning ATPase